MPLYRQKLHHLFPYYPDLSCLDLVDFNCTFCHYPSNQKPEDRARLPNPESVKERYYIIPIWRHVGSHQLNVERCTFKKRLYMLEEYYFAWYEEEWHIGDKVFTEEKDADDYRLRLMSRFFRKRIPFPTRVEWRYTLRARDWHLQQED